MCAYVHRDSGCIYVYSVSISTPKKAKLECQRVMSLNLQYLGFILYQLGKRKQAHEFRKKEQSIIFFMNSKTGHYVTNMAFNFVLFLSKQSGWFSSGKTLEMISFVFLFVPLCTQVTKGVTASRRSPWRTLFWQNALLISSRTIHS